YGVYLRTIGATAMGLATVTIVCWPALLKMFAGVDADLDGLKTPLLLTINFLLLACNVAPYYLLVALGHARAVSLITTTAIVVSLSLMLILIPRYGIEGAALARLPYGLGSLLLIWKARQQL